MGLVIRIRLIFWDRVRVRNNVNNEVEDSGAHLFPMTHISIINHKQFSVPFLDGRLLYEHFKHISDVLSFQRISD